MSGNCCSIQALAPSKDFCSSSASEYSSFVSSIHPTPRPGADDQECSLVTNHPDLKSDFRSPLPMTSTPVPDGRLASSAYSSVSSLNRPSVLSRYAPVATCRLKALVGASAPATTVPPFFVVHGGVVATDPCRAGSPAW